MRKLTNSACKSIEYEISRIPANTPKVDLPRLVEPVPKKLSRVERAAGAERQIHQVLASIGQKVEPIARATAHGILQGIEIRPAVRIERDDLVIHNGIVREIGESRGDCPEPAAEVVAPPGKHGGAVSFLMLRIQFLGYLAFATAWSFSSSARKNTSCIFIARSQKGFRDVAPFCFSPDRVLVTVERTHHLLIRPVI